MIPIPTALVLGAGASDHLNYPIGTELIIQVCARIEQNRYHDSIREQYGETKIEDFHKRLSHSADYSVDTFLERNDDLLEVGKILMVDTLKTHEIPEKIFPPGRPGWYQTLFHSLLGDSVDDIPNNPLSVITFNYDRSLEFYLHQTITSRYGISEDAASQILSKIKIIHPHGILGEYPAVPYSTEVDKATLEKMSSAIKVISEIDESGKRFCTEDFRLCHDALLAAKRIRFLGFGFHEDNVRRMDFFNETTIAEREVFATCNLGKFDKERMLKKMKKYGFSGAEFQAGQVNHVFTELIPLD